MRTSDLLCKPANQPPGFLTGEDLALSELRPDERVSHIRFFSKWSSQSFMDHPAPDHVAAHVSRHGLAGPIVVAGFAPAVAGEVSDCCIVAVFVVAQLSRLASVSSERSCSWRWPGVTHRFCDVAAAYVAPFHRVFAVHALMR